MSISLQFVGRLLFGLPMIIFGVRNIIRGEGAAGAVPAWIPGGVFWVYVTGVALVAAGLSIILVKYAKCTKIAGLLLALLLLILAFSVHFPAFMGGEQVRLVGFLKDIALAGVALVIAHYSGKTKPLTHKEG